MRFCSLFVLMVCSLSYGQIEFVFDSPWKNVRAGGKFIFAKHDATHGREIWATDASQDGAQILFAIAPGNL
ncbi:MAG TPA: hypothetical protein PLA69_03190, partial [Flavobacterium sp.]|nr:hypothetical protein [Flavobacterium sp.]